MATDYKQKYLDAIKECKMLRRENRMQLKNFNSEIRQLRNKLSIYEKKETIKNTQMNDFIQKFLFSKELLSIITNYCFKEKNFIVNPIIVGSFVRQMFELLFINGDYTKDSKLYGKPNTRDIDIIMSKDKDYYLPYQSILLLMENIMVHKELVHGYQLLSVKDLTISSNYNVGIPEGKRALQNNPHYKLVFFNEQLKKKIDIDLLGWKPKHTKGWSDNDYDINSLGMNINGICSIGKEKFNFINIMNNIYKKTAVCQIDLSYINKLANSINSGSRLNFREHISQILYFLAERTKILKDNITIQIKSKFPVYHIEDTEPCPETKVSAPYPIILLKCSDWITLPHLAKLLIEYKDNYECPRCGKDLALKLDKTECLEPDDDGFISQSARSYIRSSITKQLQPANCNQKKNYVNNIIKKKKLCKDCGKIHSSIKSYPSGYSKKLYPYPEY